MRETAKTMLTSWGNSAYIVLLATKAFGALGNLEY